MTITVHAPPVAVNPRRHRLLAYTDGVVAALAALHPATGQDLLPVGPGGHTLVPAAVDAACGPFGDGAPVLARIAVGDGELVARRIPGGGPNPWTGPQWTLGVVWIRLGLAERILAQAAAHLRGRSVGGVVTLNLPMVRGILADAAGSIAEARALLDTDGDATAQRRAHLALDEAGRSCLHLFGASGFLADGPGSEVRASELLADTYPPLTGPEGP